MKKPRGSFFLFIFLIVLILSIPGFGQEKSGPYVYWANTWLWSIGRATLDSSVVEPNFIPLGTIGCPCGLAVDGNYIYWTDFWHNPGRIGRVKIDGSNVNPDFITGCQRPWGVAVDDNFVYWTNIEPANTIGRAKLDGSEVDQNFIVLPIFPGRGIAVSGNFIYWGNMSTIARANLDGTGVDEFWITSPINNSHCIAITDTNVYWTNYGDGSIGKADLDGNNPQIWLDAGNVGQLFSLVGIAINGNYVFWGEYNNSRIGRADLSKSDCNPNWITGFGIGYILMMAATPEPKYKFDGFFSPVQNAPIVNKVNAGQTVPVKWRLTDKNGMPVSNPASFISLTSYGVDCGSLENEDDQEIEEIPVGSSGLQYLGDGNWQFNWKTPKMYAGLCRVMKLTLASNQVFTARFQFK